MTLTQDFDYLAPTSLDEALDALAHGDGGAMVLAGGTDVVPWLRDELAHPSLVVDLKRIPGLAGVETADGALRIGCLATFTDLLASDVVRERVPVLAEMAGLVASVGIRNRATLVGNLCSAVPSCDAGPLLLVLDGEIHVHGPGGPRVVPADRWFAGPQRTALGPGEIVTHVTVPVPEHYHGAAFARLSRTRREDLAQASVAVLLVRGRRCRVAFGAVAPTPVRARGIEQLIEHRGPYPDVVDRAVALVADEVAPITDVRATARYRLRMCEVMLRRALTAAGARAAGGGPPYGSPLM